MGRHVGVYIPPHPSHELPSLAFGDEATNDAEKSASGDSFREFLIRYPETDTTDTTDNRPCDRDLSATASVRLPYWREEEAGGVLLAQKPETLGSVGTGQ